MDKRWKCQRCHRWIKKGEEQFLRGLPYGKRCYEIVSSLEISAMQVRLNLDTDKEDVSPVSSSD